MPEATTEQAPAASAEDRLANFFGQQEETQEAPAEQEAAPPTETDEQPPEQTAEDSEDDGLVEIEWEGEKYRVPPKLAELKERGLRQDDYTRKTQDLADLRRQATLIADQQKQEAEFRQAAKTEFDQLQAVNSQIELYKKLDWTGMDSETLIRRKHELDVLRDQATDLQKTLNEKGQQYQKQAAVKRSEMAKNAYDYIAKHVQGWAPDSDIEKAVAKYVDQTGLPVDAFINGTLAYPSVAVLAWKALQFDKLQADKKSAIQKVKAAAPVVKPGAATPNNAAANKRMQDLRAAQKKSGSLNDTARLLAARMR